MRLVFLILAHDRPDDALELARRLVETARDAVAMIHFDVRSPAGQFAVLEAAAAAEPRIRLVAKRAAGAWGSFGLVEAPLNALAQIEAEGIAPDYVVLLSGACLPCRPVAQLERYLAENAGREFIESEDESWITGGWRWERYRYRFWFDHRTQRPLEWAFFHTQRLLRLQRRLPAGLTPRFGSQWWALTWPTCQAILRDTERLPERLRFFRSVWIPDEMVFQTYVRALVDPDGITGFGLTHFQFSNRGKPIVFHDDHSDYVRTLERFFVRKVSPHAARLRAMLLDIAAEPDDGAPLGRIGARRRDYAVKVAAQSNYPVPGQLFYRDQRTDMVDPVLARAEKPYVVVVGPPALTPAVAAHLPEALFTRLGALFAPDVVDLGSDADGAPRATFHGLGRGDAAVRDLHPALYLARARARCDGVPVIRWSPFEAPDLLAAVLRDPRALVVACLPFTGVDGRDRQLLAFTASGDLARIGQGPSPAALGIAPERAARARADELGAVEGGWLDWLGRDLFYFMKDGEHLLRSASVALPWNPRGSALNAAQRRRFLEESLGACRFASFPWFPSLRRAAVAAWEDLEADTMALLGPMPREAAAVLGDILGDAPDREGPTAVVEAAEADRAPAERALAVPREASALRRPEGAPRRGDGSAGGSAPGHAPEPTPEHTPGHEPEHVSEEVS